MMKTIRVNKAVQLIIATAFVFSPHAVQAAVSITEVMYDLPGADAGREWLEIHNDGPEVDLSGFKVFDTANHVLNVPPKNGGIGDMKLASGEYAIIAADASVFLGEHGNYSGTVIDSTLGLPNETGNIKLLNGDGVEIASFSYSKTLGAAGDGLSLHKSGSGVKADTESPGTESAAPSGNSTQYDNDETTQDDSSDQNNFTPVDVENVRLEADAGGDRTVIAGSDAIFNAKAYGTSGPRKANYIWNFGDGDVVFGATAMHKFYYPGDYAVSLTAYTGSEKDVDVITVSAIDSPISISEVSRDYLKIKNASASDIDLSLWHLRSNGQTWSFPSGSVILKKAEITLSNKRTGLAGGQAEILFPNGEIADRYEPRHPELEVAPARPTIKLASFTATPLVAVAPVIETPDESSEEVTQSAEENLPEPPPVKDDGILKWGIFLTGFIGTALFFFFSIKNGTKKTDPEDALAEEFEIEEELL